MQDELWAQTKSTLFLNAAVDVLLTVTLMAMKRLFESGAPMSEMLLYAPLGVVGYATGVLLSLVAMLLLLGIYRRGGWVRGAKLSLIWAALNGLIAVGSLYALLRLMAEQS